MTVGLTTVVLMAGTLVAAAVATVPVAPIPARTVGKGIVGAGKVGKFVAALRSMRARISAIEFVLAAVFVCARASMASAAITRRRIGFITYFLGGLAELFEIVLLVLSGLTAEFVVRDGGGVVIVFGEFVFGGAASGGFVFAAATTTLVFVAGLGAEPDAMAVVAGAFFFW